MTLKVAIAQLNFVVGDVAGNAYRPGQSATLRHPGPHPGPVYALIAPGYGRAMVERVARLIKINEYKRLQAPVGIRVTHRSFGKDWRYPITSKFNETAGKPKP